MTILTFLVITIIFWAAGIAFNHIMQFSIQDGQWFDMLFDWQNRLNKWSQSPSKWKQGLAKMGGDCGMCFSHALTVFNYICYVIFCNLILHTWVSDPINIKSRAGYWIAFAVVNMIWYMVFVSIGSIASFMLIYIKKKK